MNEDDKPAWSRDLALVADAARQAGAVALEYFKKSPEVWWKNEGRSPVSAADYAANEILESLLRTARPGYGWLSEETDDDAARLSRDTVFVVDPIDGTRAFLAGADTWCVSVAVVHKGKPVAGALYAPALGEVFLAEENGAATRNGERISVSAPEKGSVSRVAVAEDMLGSFPAALRQTIKRVKHVPSLAYRLALVADGRIDGTLVKPNAHDWDLAAADLILQCAGGKLVDVSGSPLVYNGASVRHGALCGASAAVLPSLLPGLKAVRSS